MNDAAVCFDVQVSESLFSIFVFLMMYVVVGLLGIYLLSEWIFLYLLVQKKLKRTPCPVSLVLSNNTEGISIPSSSCQKFSLYHILWAFYIQACKKSRPISPNSAFFHM